MIQRMNPRLARALATLVYAAIAIAFVAAVIFFRLPRVTPAQTACTPAVVEYAPIARPFVLLITLRSVGAPPPVVKIGKARYARNVAGLVEGRYRSSL